MVLGKKTRLMLTIMDSGNGVDSAVCNDLVVSDLDENVAILFPNLLSGLAMIVGRDEIPKQDVERWSHLEGHVYLIDLNMDLLIGAGVPEALQLRKIIPATDRGPYAPRVEYVPYSRFFFTSKEIHPIFEACPDLVDASYSDGPRVLRDDLNFMNIVEDSAMQCADGHYQVLLPLRNRNVEMPVNRSQAEQSASHFTSASKRRSSSDTKRRKDAIAFL